MPMQNAILTYGVGGKLTPCYPRPLAAVVPINLPPGVTLAAGTVLGQVGTGSVNAVQTITAPGSGTYTISGVNPLTQTAWTTTALAFGANDAAVLAAILAAVGTGGSGITVASLAVTFGGAFAGRPVQLMTVSAGSVANTTPGQTAKTFNAYASGHSDGTQNPSLLLEYNVTTDANGWVNSSATFAYQTQPFATAFMSGAFNVSELTGLDANAVTKMGGAIKAVAGANSLGTFVF